ncbi:MAG: DNA polymerase III subunit gamma/tau [Alicyclobacillus herbarius]|uniref:DNA polymerase III subunit gamma/tau n=1 Tax=Alicyclobacillus herbarius TaxID=122960 RepID=UPI002357D136|nr:DNA polymerase III subunit gamma/tau [Alicyclobacillus herbarius]MCL6633039.1 DNA polymerase III subunit gamma/tau [Alicyclobacillus herbarius]
MSYQAIYRAWRPQTFSDLVGQPHVRQTLTNAILRGQVAHAYLFCGPRGTGKTSAAKVLAKAVNCSNRQGANPCNACEACLSINQGANVDVEEIDAASNRGVDEIRQLRDKVQYAPASLEKKVYIVDEVHMLTTEAFNALLKTLEEPPGHTLFVLATTEPHKIPATIISRCQRFEFRRIAPEAIVERLREVCTAEGWQAEEAALWRIAHAADGGLRDALGLLEQTAAFAENGQIRAADAAHVMGGVDSEGLLRLVAALAAGDVAQVLSDLAAWYASGKDAARIVHDLLQTLRDVFVVKVSPDALDIGPLLPLYQQAAADCPEDWLLYAVQKLGETYTGLRYVEQPRLALETSLLAVAVSAQARSRTATLDPIQTAHRPGAAGGAALASSGLENRAGSAPAAAPGHMNKKPGTSGEMGTFTGAAGKPVAVMPEGNPPAPSSPSAPTRRRAELGKNRKMQVLAQLADAANADVLARVQNVWPQVLERVRSQEIQTHAWLMGGEPVLATDDTVVIAFASRIHRDAVMKPPIRASIESALSEVSSIPLRFLALHRPDWEAFVAEQGAPDKGTPVDDDREALLAKAVEVFGEDVVEIMDGE